VISKKQYSTNIEILVDIEIPTFELRLHLTEYRGIGANLCTTIAPTRTQIPLRSMCAGDA
jgi:hypothetical protein